MRSQTFAPVTVLLLFASFAAAGDRTKIFVESTVDGTPQPCYLILPESFDPSGPDLPLLVSLHSWSGTVEQRNLPLEQLTDQRGWIYLFPNFRGRNDDPEACGSVKAQQDILDAVAWVKERYPVDCRRIYLTGASGGGHMTMLMVGRHPHIWAAASAWVGISDLAAWHERHADDNYGAMLRKSCGGAPGENEQVDRQYRQRSPLTHLHRATGVPLEIAAGVHDGHQGSVPIRHSLEAFNVVAKAAGETPIREEEIVQLSRPAGRLEQPQRGDLVKDDSYGRAIYLRRHAAKSRVTIFEGGHEGIPAAAVEWLAKHARADRAAVE